MTAWGNVGLWDREYEEARAIPSSHRLAPSHSIITLQEGLGIAPGARVLDAGAGTGRHSLWLARQGCTVDAVDVSPVACELLTERVWASGLTSITVTNERLDPGNLPDEQYDIILDSYVSCHILDEDDRRWYLSGLREKLRPGGKLYTACLGADDEYYAEQADGLLATDPLNGITKLLQPRSEFKLGLMAVASHSLAIVSTFEDEVRDRTYDREVFAGIMSNTRL